MPRRRRGMRGGDFKSVARDIGRRLFHGAKNYAKENKILSNLAYSGLGIINPKLGHHVGSTLEQLGYGRRRPRHRRHQGGGGLPAILI